MRTDNLTLLLVVTIAAIAVAVVTSNYRSAATSKEKILLFPELNSNINDIVEIGIQNNQEKITLLRKDNKWVIKEADNYPALFNKIKQTVIATSELQLVANKTKNPAHYSRLGVGDPDNIDSTSHLLTLKDSSGKQLVSLIIGKSRLSKSAIDKPGLYVRHPDQEQSLLVAGQLDVSAQFIDWIERDLFDIQSDRIRAIKIEHKDDVPVSLNRDAGVDDFTLANIPEGKQVQTEFILNRMETMLENIFVDDIKAANKIDFPDTQTTTTLNTFDGLIVTVTSAVIDGKKFSRFSFGYDASLITKTDTADKQDGTADAADVSRETETLSGKTAGWAFEIPEYKFELFTRKLEDLIKEEEKLNTASTEKI